VAEEDPEVRPAQPLYDVLPSPNAGAPDFTISAPPEISVSQGRSATTRILTMPRGSFEGSVNLSALGLPDGVTAAFSPASTTGSSVLTFAASPTTASATAAITISGTSGNLSHNATTKLSVTPILTGTVPVNLSSVFNVTGIYKDGSKFDASTSLDGDGYALSEQAVGADPVGVEVVFRLGPANAPDAVTSKTIALPSGKFSSLKILGLAVEGNQKKQTFTVDYTDGTSSPFTQSLSDWAEGGNLLGESVAVQVPYRLAADGSKDGNPFNLCAYSFALDGTKTVRSISLPSNRNVLVFAITLVPAGK